MSYLRSVRLPEEVKAPMQEEAARRGVSVNRLFALLVQEGLGVAGSTAVVQAPAAVTKGKPTPARKAKASTDGESNSPPKAKAAPKAPKRDAVVECRHGIPDCRICRTGRWAE